ncbi:MAG: DEAD/DEAH box helicase, partial [Actinomycetota bacterium]
MAPEPFALLADVFGHAGFRPGQEEAVQAALDGRDALVVMPTGSGKSLCYQLPALGALRLTIVVSPLLALMRDQVEALRILGRDDVAALSSDTPADEVERVLDALRGEGGSLLAPAPAVRLLYVAPERFANARFAAALAEARVDLLVVDEAHCLSEWGHDFRPDYGRLAQVRERIRPRAVMALTATATR